MATTFTMKRGDTFHYAVMWEGAALSELRSQIRDTYGGLVANVQIEPAAAPHTFRLSFDDTANWPTGVLQTDIQRTSAGGLIESTETMTIAVEKDVTR